VFASRQLLPVRLLTYLRGGWSGKIYLADAGGAQALFGSGDHAGGGFAALAWLQNGLSRPLA
jgi:hypothetical protein